VSKYQNVIIFIRKISNFTSIVQSVQSVCFLLSLKDPQSAFDLIYNSEISVDISYTFPEGFTYDKIMLDCYVEGIPIIEKYPKHQISQNLLSFAKRLIG